MNREIKSYLAAIERWIKDQQAKTKSEQGLTSDERKQLLAVEKSIQQLTALGVGIPDELRQLKLQLSAKDVAQLDIANLRKRAEEVSELVGALSKLVQSAKALRNQLSTKPGTPVNKQHYEVTLRELIKRGYLSMDDTLELALKKTGPVFEGKLNADGAVSVKTSSGWQEFKSLSSAASAVGECQLNGWLYWWRIDSEGARTRLKDIRAKFIKEGRSP